MSAADHGFGMKETNMGKRKRVLGIVWSKKKVVKDEVST
jgi:hypothetical protein